MWLFIVFDCFGISPLVGIVTILSVVHYSLFIHYLYIHEEAGFFVQVEWLIKDEI